MIDRYDNTTAALQGGNDGAEIKRVISEEEVYLSVGTDTIYNQSQISFASLHDYGDWIDRIRIDGLDDGDIKDVAFLPQDLTELEFSTGSLTHLDVGRLPRGLEVLILNGNQISEMDLTSSSPSLKALDLGNNPLEEQGITLKLPLPERFEIKVSEIGSLNLNGGIKYPVDDAGNWEVKWSDGSLMKVHAKVEQVNFDFSSMSRSINTC